MIDPADVGSNRQRSNLMRELDEEERATMQALETDLPTSDLIGMAADLADILRGRGLVIQACLIDAMARRLTELEAGPAAERQP